jgi:hypothetical protein
MTTNVASSTWDQNPGQTTAGRCSICAHIDRQSRKTQVGGDVEWAPKREKEEREEEGRRLKKPGF